MYVLPLNTPSLEFSGRIKDAIAEITLFFIKRA
jgi:hypothetical protein